MDDAVICRREAEIGFLLMKNKPLNSGVTYPLCFKPCTEIVLSSSTRQQQQLRLLLKMFIESHSKIIKKAFKKVVESRKYIQKLKKIH